ncbi:hypothetical protein VE04_10241 [Pseudogymnoascus sp. 24MN13]|nr:hypothetical protein VE04_10241 [Pseudogymnoascus sp. 24MN13]
MSLSLSRSGCIRLCRRQGMRGGVWEEPGGGTDPGVLQGLHLEQLPAYEPAAATAVAPGTEAASADEVRRASVVDGQTTAEPESAAAQQPDEPPPGYEEAQAQAVGIDLDQRLRRRAEFGRDSGDE